MDLSSLPVCGECRWYFEDKDRHPVFRALCSTCGAIRLEALILDLVNARTSTARRRALKALKRLAVR